MPHQNNIQENQHEANRQVVLSYVAAFNAGDMERLQEIFAPDALVYGALGWGQLDKIVPIWEQLHQAFGFQLHVEDIMAQDDTVVARFLERGTSRAPFRGQEPTGKSSEVLAIEWFVIRDGRIHRRWGVRDSASHFRQMGLVTG